MNKKSNSKTLKIRKPKKDDVIHEVVPFIPPDYEEEFAVIFEPFRFPKYKTLKPRKSPISKKKNG
jgi:hypothetical protein